MDSVIRCCDYNCFKLVKPGEKYIQPVSLSIIHSHLRLFGRGRRRVELGRRQATGDVFCHVHGRRRRQVVKQLGHH